MFDRELDRFPQGQSDFGESLPRVVDRCSLRRGDGEIRSVDQGHLLAVRRPLVGLVPRLEVFLFALTALDVIGPPSVAGVSLHFGSILKEPLELPDRDAIPDPSAQIVRFPGRLHALRKSENFGKINS